MKHIKLNAEQINKLLTKKHIQVKSNHIEFLENTLIVNKNGFVSDVQSLTISYEDKNYECEQLIIILQKLVCEHLNLEPEQVLYQSGISTQDVVFRIKVVPDKDLALVVCSRSQATNSASEQETRELASSNRCFEQIGLYKRLGNSAYYFRWLDDFV